MPLVGSVGPEDPVQEIPSAVIGGNKALTIQDYTSLNCKRDAQFEASTYVPALAAGAVVDYIVEVGALPVLIKGRRIQFTETGVRLEMYKDPEYSGGSLYRTTISISGRLMLD